MASETVFGVILTLLLLSVLTVAPNIQPARASPGPTYMVDPPLVEQPAPGQPPKPGETFWITVNISDAVDVYAWEFKISWDTYLLDVTGAREGGFLKSGGMPTSFAKTALDTANLQGWMLVGCTRIGAIPGANGIGILANMTFYVKTSGESALDLYDSNRLDATLNRYYDVTEVDGYVKIIEPVPPVADFTLWPEPPKPFIAEEPITFNATYNPVSREGSYDPDGGNATYPSGIVSYLWDFGDGNTTLTTTPIINHTYTEAENYKVNLTVTDDEGVSKGLDILKDVIIHVVDVAIIAVESSAQWVIPGSTVDVTISINNTGTLASFESGGTGTLNITAYYFNASYTGIIGNASISSVPFFDPPAYYWLNKTISWNTTGLSLGIYTIKANVSDPLYGETNLADNELVDGNVTISEFELRTHEVVVGEVTFTVVTKSNSTVSNFGFSPALREISFDVEGEDGTIGFCNVTIPKLLLNGDFTVKIDDVSIVPILTQNATHSFLYFTYTHTIHKVQISGTTVALPPVADFTWSPQSPYRGQIVMFNASASYDPDGSIANYTWNFDDGNTTTVTDPIIYHAFMSTGGFLVELRVTDNHGLSNTKKLGLHDLDVLPIHDVSVLEITVSTATIVAGESVTVNATVKNEGDTSESFNVTISYDGTIIKSYRIQSFSPGAVNSTVYAWNTTGASGGSYLLKAEAKLTGETSAFLDDNIQEIPILIQEKPITDFTFTPADPVVGQTVMFNASASNDPDGSIANYTWNFGDGNTTTVTSNTIVHTYSTSATYTVNLTTTDNDGLATHKTMQVSIGKETSTITLTLSPEAITVGEDVALSGQISPVRAGVTVELMYRLGGEGWSTLTTVTDANGEYQYSWRPEEAGTYEVKASWEGDTNTLPHESAVQNLTVNPPPISPTVYIVAGAIVAGAAIGLIYIFVLRKPKPT